MTFTFIHPLKIVKTIESRQIEVEFNKSSPLYEELKKEHLRQKIAQIFFQFSDIFCSPLALTVSALSGVGSLISGILYSYTKHNYEFSISFLTKPDRFFSYISKARLEKDASEYLKKASTYWISFKVTLIVMVSLIALFILGLVCELVAGDLFDNSRSYLTICMRNRESIMENLKQEPKTFAFMDPFFFFDDEIVAKALEADFRNIELLPEAIAKQVLLAMCQEDISYDQKIPSYLQKDLGFMQEIREIIHRIPC